MSTSQGSSNGDATRRDSTELGVEASTPPNTAHTQQADRSRSADRHAAHGNEARDERRPYRIPRQPNISSAERSGVEASAVEASLTQEMTEDTRVHQPPEEPAVNSDSGAAHVTNVCRIASRASRTSRQRRGREWRHRQWRHRPLRNARGRDRTSATRATIRQQRFRSSSDRWHGGTQRAQHVAHVRRWSWDWRHRGASSTKSTESADADDRAAPADV